MQDLLFLLAYLEYRLCRRLDHLVQKKCISNQDSFPYCVIHIVERNAYHKCHLRYTIRQLCRVWVKDQKMRGLTHPILIRICCAEFWSDDSFPLSIGQSHLWWLVQMLYARVLHHVIAWHLFRHLRMTLDIWYTYGTTKTRFSPFASWISFMVP